MRYAGSITLPNVYFMKLVEYTARSLKVHGFTDIVFIGDSGGNQRGMKAVADRLNEKWGKKLVHYVREFYDNEGVIRYMNEDLGITEPQDDGIHDFYWATVMQMVTDPKGKMTYPDQIKTDLFCHLLDCLSGWNDRVYFYLCMEKREIWREVFGRAPVTNQRFSDEIAEEIALKLGVGVVGYSGGSR